jgi:fructosamine-3-kinase
MRSKTKMDFPRSTIEAMVRARFGSSVRIADVQPLTDGWFNSAYSISFAGGHPDVVLRIAPDPEMPLLTYEKGLMRSEVKVYELVQQKLSIPLPHLYGYNFDRDIINHDYMFIARLSGSPLDKVISRIGQENVNALECELGSYSAQIHSLKGSRFGYIGDESGQHNHSWQDAFLGMVFTLLDDGMALGVGLPATYQEIKSVFSALSPVLLEIRRPSLVHWDLWPPNIFVIQEKGSYRIEGIVDWERAFWGDPEAELVLATKPPGSLFFSGYGRGLEDSRSAVIRRCLYRTHLWLVVVIESRVRFENAEHVKRAYAALERDFQTLRGYLQ